MDGLGKGILGGVLFEAKSWMRYLLPTKYFAGVRAGSCTVISGHPYSSYDTGKTLLLRVLL